MIIGRTITQPILIGAGALVILLGTTLGISRCQLKNARESIGMVSQQVEQCREDLQHENSQVTELTEDLDTLTQTIAIERAAFESARLEAERLARQRERESEAERQARAQIYADNPDCEQWAQVLVCQDMADRMIERRQRLIQRWEGRGDE